MNQTLTTGASTNRRRGSIYLGDMPVAVSILLILAMLMLPLPPWFIDCLVASNIACGIVLLLMSLYIQTGFEFSAFPNMLLVSTLFRLSLSIATTRQILLHGHAGHIIDAFGKLGAGDNLVVGLVVFLIITAVQFIVVAKGAERVAEIVARFTLDALPGKQMSIDGDLKSGLISRDEAIRKRENLKEESKLYGDLDGTMKFVKGDAIAGLLIVGINLIGGLAIGVMQQGMDVSDAMTKYSILSIGEGMVSQIPALLSTISAGFVVTCGAGKKEDRHLFSTMGGQISAKPHVLAIAGGLCIVLAGVPGFPWVVFLLFAVAFLGGAALLVPALNERWRSMTLPARERVLGKDVLPEELSTGQSEPQVRERLSLEVPQVCVQGDAMQALSREVKQAADMLAQDLGIRVPPMGLHAVPDAPGAEATASWRLLASGVPIAGGDWPARDPHRTLCDSVLGALRRSTERYFSLNDAIELRTSAGRHIPDVVDQLRQAVHVSTCAEVLQTLVKEGVSIRNQRDVFEAMLSAAWRGVKDLRGQVEFVRSELRHQISHQVAPEGRLRAVTLSPELEDVLSEAATVHNGLHALSLEPGYAMALTRAMVACVQHERPAAIVVHAGNIRHHVRSLIEADCFDIAVLSTAEIVGTVDVDMVATVALPSPSMEFE